MSEHTLDDLIDADINRSGGELSGFTTRTQALAAGEAAGIADPAIWVDSNDRFHFDFPEDPAPTGTKIVSETVVGNEIVFELANGAIIRQLATTEEEYQTPGAAALGAFEAGLTTDQMEIFGQDGAWHFRIKQQTPAAPSSFFTQVDPNTGNLLLVDRTTGDISTISEGPDIQEPKVVDVGGEQFAFNPNTGSFTQIRQTPEPFEPGFIDEDQGLFQQRSGAITQFATQSLDDIIVQALIDGEFEKAFAFQDFQDRPTAAESLSFALQFARSPADQQIISEIARGVSTVDQGTFDSTSPRRVGPQPSFLIDAYNDFQRRLFAGREPTDTEANEFRKRFLEGASPESDKLRAEIAAIEAKTAGTLQSNLDAAAKAAAEREATAAKAKLEVDAGALGTTSGGVTGQFQETGVSQNIDLARTLFKSIPADTFAGITGLTPTSLTEASLALTQDQDISTLSGAQQNLINTFSSGGQVESIDVSTTPKTAEDFSSLGFSQAELGSLGFFARGGLTGGDQLEVVGEEGPELVDIPAGSTIIPLKKLSKKQAMELKRLGVKGFQEGGITFDGISNLPIGLQQLQFGRAITPSRGNLLRAANLAQPSQQALQNLTPESVAIFRDQAALAGIPPGALEQELALTRPGGRRLPRGRFRPLQLAGIR